MKTQPHTSLTRPELAKKRFRQLAANASYADLSPPEVRTTRRRLRACHECDWVSALPPLKSGEKACCPRCGHTLVKRHRYPAQRSMALAISALIVLILAISFPFVRFSVSGIGNEIELTQTATTLIGFHQPIVAIAVIMSIVVLPAVYLVGLIWLQLSLLMDRRFPFAKDVSRSLTHLTPWLMTDVFIVGALVSLIKIAGIAQITLGASFWAFCAFAVLLLVTIQSVDGDWLWFSLEDGEPLAPEGTQTGTTAASQGLIGCATCGLINRPENTRRPSCQRCHERLHTRYPQSLQRTWALLAAAIVMYIPANIYPIMITTSLGNESPSTIIGGVVELIQMGSWPIALVIFVASVIVPVGKLVALIWLCLVVSRSSELNAHNRTVVYRITEFIGRWSMVDVFVVAILVALIRAGSLLSITPGPAALAFGSVVVLTMLAAMTFDPRLIWDNPLPHGQRRHHVNQEAVDGK